MGSGGILLAGKRVHTVQYIHKQLVQEAHVLLNSLGGLKEKQATPLGAASSFMGTASVTEGF